jgi:hypothetical protein
MNRNLFAIARDTAVAGVRKIKNGTLAALSAFALVAALAPSKAQAALVSYDGTNVEWSVTDLLTPLTTALVAAIGAAVVIFTIVVGVRWIFRMVKSK